MKCEKCGKDRKEGESYEWIFGKKIGEEIIKIDSVSSTSKVSYGDFKRIRACLCRTCLDLKRKEKRIRLLVAIPGLLAFGFLTIFSLIKEWSGLISIGLGIVAFGFGAYSVYGLLTGFTKEGAELIIKEFAWAKAELLGLDYCWSPEEYEKLYKPGERFSLEGDVWIKDRWEKCTIILTAESAEFKMSDENFVIPKHLAKYFIKNPNGYSFVIEKDNKKYLLDLDVDSLSSFELWYHEKDMNK